LRRVITQSNPDIVHSYGWMALPTAAALTGRKTPLVLAGRDYGSFCATRTLVRNGLLCDGPAALRCLHCAGNYYGRPKGWAAVVGTAFGRPLLRRKVRGLHSISTFVDDAMNRFLIRDNIVDAVIPSFATDDADESGTSLDPYLEALPDKPFILFVGAFRKVKGLETLFDAYERLDDPPPLVLIGTFERDSPRTFPAGSTILTDVPHAAVLAAWDRALFGVVPSLWPEPLGAVVFEGMARGKAIIGTRPGGHEDMIVDGHTGLLVSAGDAGELSDAMKRLIFDADLRERMAAAARERSIGFEADTVIPRIEQFFLDVLESDRARRG
jgi:glycosyltransferase involved in cell wall biosynthesis